ncbi:hypothetical protein RIF29_15330 [Crotalaria pallida]|uniref:Uncharacterized protein n=1 Tax=Crotalaria pallida TaxID=3830 RepID=A0AAN9FLK0_CROPI
MNSTLSCHSRFLLFDGFGEILLAELLALRRRLLLLCSMAAWAYSRDLKGSFSADTMANGVLEVLHWSISGLLKTPFMSLVIAADAVGTVFVP